MLVPSRPQLKSVNPCNLIDYRGFLILFNSVFNTFDYSQFLMNVKNFILEQTEFVMFFKNKKREN